MSEDLSSLRTARDLIRYAASQFNRHQLYFGHGTDNALDEALALVIYALDLDYNIPENYLDCRLTEAEKTSINDLIYQRIHTKKPLAYLTGKSLFAGIEFNVSEAVLVPRSPIAELIEHAYFPWVEPEDVHYVLDLCTGSGCIGLASALHLPNSHVVISDISEDALNIARQNIALHHLENRASAINSNLFDNLPQQQFDLIVSNPPYVSTGEYEQLPDEYHREPKLGLEAGEDGMDIVHRILAQAFGWLTDNGVLIVEVGASAELLMQRYPEIDFNWIEFDHGGDGVFVMTRDELGQFR